MNIKEMVLLLIIVLSVIGFGYAVYYSFFSTPDFNAVGKNTVVTLVNIMPDKNGVKGDYTFNCNGDIRTAGGHVISRAICGDKYEALYDSSNCRHVKILFERPVFSDTEIVGVTTGEIYEVAPFFLDLYVKFKYSVGERMYERLQYLEDKKYPEVKKGAKFPVKYWVENPKRSIIYIEKNK
jgi:hypothetical protein